MKTTFFDPADAPERRIEKLLKISDALMRRVEQATDESGDGYRHFQHAVMLESQVRDRTHDLERTLRLLNDSNARLAAANEAAQSARASLYNALEAVEEGFALFGADDAMVMFNSRFCRPAPDVRAELAEGLPFNEYIRLISESVHLDRAEAGDANAWADRRRALHQEDHALFNVRFLDGTWLQVSEHRTPDGGTAILQTDITDMIRIERAERDKLLDDQAQMIRATLDHINQGVAVFDAHARLVGWNGRLGALLTPPMHLVRLGAPFEALFDHIRRGAVFDGVDPENARAWVAAKGGREPLSFDMRRAGGVVLSVFAQETPERGFVISFTDVSAERRAIAALHEANETLERRVRERTAELRDALREAERANASKSRFVAAASHDLLQPLSAAKLFLSSMGSMAMGDAPRDAARRAENALEGVESILSALLEISRLDSGRVEVKKGPVDLGRLLGQLAEEYGPAAEARGLRLRVRALDEMVTSDPTYLRRILQNLVSNAIRYTASGGILVAARRAPAGIRVEVWDTGPGIPEDKRTDIFKEFQRLDRSGRAESGIGLGLTIVDRACALLGHEMWLDSVVGRGSRFSVMLPRGARKEPRRPTEARPGPALGANLLALVIDDNEEFRQALALQLESWGVSAFDAPTADAALRLLDDTGVSPDLLLVDYALGDGELGPDVVARLRLAHGLIPAAIITASREHEVRTRCFRDGLRLISKPVDEADLFNFVSLAS